jgi:hypothetical protein
MTGRRVEILFSRNQAGKPSTGGSRRETGRGGWPSGFPHGRTPDSALDALSSSRRDVSVMTAERPLSLSTRAAKTPVLGLPLRQGATNPVSSSHRRGRGRAHSRAALEWCVTAPAPYPGAPAGQVVAPSCRHAEVLPVASAVGSEPAWSSCVTRRAYLAADPAAGVRGDTRAAAATDAVAVVVGVAGGVHQVARGLVDGRDRQRLFRCVPVSGWYVGVCRWAWVAFAGVAGRADVSGVACVASRRWVVVRVGDGWHVRPPVTL